MKLPNQLQLQTFESQCKNLKVVKGYVESYQEYTRNTVENILKLSSMIVEMKEKEKSGELDKTDMNYFCFKVGLKRDGSTFRKFEQIGKQSDLFQKYIDKLPDSFTVLYEITTLDPDLFEELMVNNDIHSYVTLKDIKRLGNKLSTSSPNPEELNFTVNFDLKSFPEDELKKFRTVIKYLYQIGQKNIIEFNVPKDQIGKFGLVGSWNPEKKCWIKEEERKINQPILEEEFYELEE
jgi:hypothetical protein